MAVTTDTDTDEQLQQRMEGLRQQALMEMQTNPEAVRQRLRARGASEEQIAGLFKNVGIDMPTGPAPGQTALPTQQIQPASVQHGAGTYYSPQGQLVLPEVPISAQAPGPAPGQVVLPTQQIQPAYAQYGAGAQTLPSGQVALPEIPIVAGAPPMNDEDILKGGMYVQPQQGTMARKQ